MKIRSTLLALSLLALSIVAGSRTPAAEDASEAPYGFASQEIMKVGWGCFGLEPARIDGDDRDDLVFVNNPKARIDVYLSRPDGVGADEVNGDLDVNDFPEGRLFLRKEVLTEMQVTTMALGDLNGDGITDIVYSGKPVELVIAYGDGEGGFGKTRTFPVEDPIESWSALAIGDLNADGRNDLAFLTTRNTALYYQSATGVLEEPVRIAHPGKGTWAVRIEDLDADGRQDLLHIVANDARPIRIRFQEEGGALGPEFAVKMAPFRSINFVELDGDPGRELLVVQRQSGLLRVLEIAPGESSGGKIKLGGVQRHTFLEQGGSRSRKLAIGDIDGDGRNDVLVTEPATARIALHLQTARGTLRPERLFPSLADADVLLAVDFEGDGKCAAVVLSSKEKAVGISTLDADGRLSYPKSLPVQGDPKAMAAGDLDGDGRPELVVVSRHEDQWQAWLFGQPEEGEFGLSRSFPMPSLSVKKDEPTGLLVLDMDGDDRADLLVFDQYKSMRTFLQEDDGTFRDVSGQSGYGAGLVEKKELKDVATVDLDGDGRPSLLVAGKNFARALELSGGHLTVRDQINARSSASQIKSLCGADLTGDGRQEVALLDSDGNMLTVLVRDESGVYQVAANFETGNFAFEGMTSADMNGDGRDDLVILGRDGFGVLINGGADYELKEIRSYESAIKDANLYETAVGDLNADGKPDVALTDTRNFMIELVSLKGEKDFRHEMKWRIFEKKIHGGRDRGGSQPHEIACGDFNGDGRADLAIMVHDRLIVYPQDE